MRHLAITTILIVLQRHGDALVPSSSAIRRPTTQLRATTTTSEAWERLTNRLQETTVSPLWGESTSNELLFSMKQQVFVSWFSHHLPVAGWTPPSLFSASPFVWAVVTILSTLSLLYTLSFPAPDYRQNKEPYARGQYDPIAAQLYYPQQAPFVVLQRLLQLFRLSNSFIWKVLIWDKYIMKQNTNNPAIQKQRANELLSIVQQLGPTAIKIGQALSVRPDLIASDYAQALATLQDAVPPFPNAQPVWEQYTADQVPPNVKVNFDQPPMASASIGQVYQGTIPETGQTVAIKLQRPNVLAEIALDLYIVQNILLPLYQSIPANANSNLQPLIQEWGRGFIAELDYRQEARTTMQFNQAMQERQLDKVLMAPKVVWYSERVLMTEWVFGKRLDQIDDPKMVPQYCSVALNAYLIMLLELQQLHCDPHRTCSVKVMYDRYSDIAFSRSCLFSSFPNIQSRKFVNIYRLLEFVAHLTAEQYDSLPQDLCQLGFLKPEKLEFAQRSGVLEPLKYFLKQAGKGGGADQVRERIFDEYRAKFPGLSDDELRLEMRSEMKSRMQDIVQRESIATGITMQVEDLQEQNRDSFQIPEWFVYTSRAFLTLEGVSLQADPSYSLIQSCFPYVAQRLVADEDPRAKRALQELLYGSMDNTRAKRLQDLAQGITSYKATNTKTVNTSAKDNTAATIALLKDGADILLNPQGNLLQTILLEEGALAASAQVKDLLQQNLLLPSRVRELLSLPKEIELPLEKPLQRLLQKTPSEEQAQTLASTLFEMAQEQQPPLSSTPRSLELEQTALILKELRESAPKYVPWMGTLGNKFVAQLWKTAQDNWQQLEKQ
ncbi:hypothetical protein FisN_7Lh370 [Fistulifera solaris]|uniref:ABC1 atypical kinase-like domain-containing protein n=1 Tax=Fistulifera solaris TaxID=1519565 RepID=A0A1Z5JBY1_FISSO|nr:hypothetical protein FisN_7Lh370 [Fistulifera solaris]|eukprot:GAX11271.1 hypothetical protein FisN_7Lh370 [Fistulifera solaris]